MGLFASPNRAGIMNSLPPERRGVGAGMSATFQNSAMVLSIGTFFTLIILGLASPLLRGGRYVHEEHGEAVQDAVTSAGAARPASAGTPAGVIASGHDDLEGGQAGVLRVGDPAPVGRHLAQRR